MKKSDQNLRVLQNFILHITHDDETPMTLTASELYQMAEDYIEEDHADGRENPEDETEITVGEHKMPVDIFVNQKGNIEVRFTDEDLKKMPNGFVFEGHDNELIIYPYKP